MDRVFQVVALGLASTTVVGLASIAGNVYMNTGERRPMSVDTTAVGDDSNDNADTKPKIVPPVSTYRNVS